MCLKCDVSFLLGKYNKHCALENQFVVKYEVDNSIVFVNEFNPGVPSLTRLFDNSMMKAVSCIEGAYKNES